MAFFFINSAELSIHYSKVVQLQIDRLKVDVIEVLLAGRTIHHLDLVLICREDEGRVILHVDYAALHGRLRNHELVY